MRRLTHWKRTGKIAAAVMVLAGCTAAPTPAPSPEAASEGRVVRKPSTVAIQGSVREPAGPLADTRIWLATAAGQPLDPAVEATSDADGKWAMPRAPIGRHLVVADRAGGRYLTFAQATAALPSVRLTLGSTLIAGAAVAARPDAIAAFDQGAFDRTVYDVDRAYKDRAAPDLADPAAALAAVAADVPGLPGVAEALGFRLP